MATIYGLSPLGVSVFVKLLRLVEVKVVDLVKVVLIEGTVGEVVTGEHIQVNGFLSQTDLWKSVALKLKGKFNYYEQLKIVEALIKNIENNVTNYGGVKCLCLATQRTMLQFTSDRVAFLIVVI